MTCFLGRPLVRKKKPDGRGDGRLNQILRNAQPVRGAGQALRRRLQRYGVVYLVYHPRRHARVYRPFLVADPDWSCPIVYPVLGVTNKHSRTLGKTGEDSLRGTANRL